MKSNLGYLNPILMLDHLELHTLYEEQWSVTSLTAGKAS